jgi:hypothetical protein
MPTYQAYVYVPAYYVPMTIPTIRPYAAPTAAPPSVSEGRPTSVPSTREPPRVSESRAPAVKETAEPPVAGDRSTMARKPNAISREADTPSADASRVSFLNLSPRDLVVKVDGTARSLPQGEKLNVRVKKQFVWQVAGAEAQLERIPADKNSLTIVIRR